MSGQSERDVERLVAALLDSTGVTSIDTPQGRAFRVALAQRILASDWLTERDAAIRAEAKAEALAEVRALIEEQRRTTPVASASPIDAGIRAADRDWIQRLTALLDGGEQS